MQTASIVTDPDSRRARTFRANLVGYVLANALIDTASSGNVDRPVWSCWAGSEQELRAFMANVRLGKKINLLNLRYGRNDKKFEFLKKGGFQQTWQTEPEGAVATVYLPDLFRLDPGMVDPQRIGFILMPPDAWLNQQGLPDRNVQEAIRAIQVRTQTPRDAGMTVDARFVKLASLLAAYLDRRTRCPIPNSTVFHAVLLYACLEAGLVRFPQSCRDYCFSSVRSHYAAFEQVGTELIGIGPGLCYSSSHDEFEQVLAVETKRFFAEPQDAQRVV